MSNYPELMKRNVPEWPYPVHYGKENESKNLHDTFTGGIV